jgi:hypothetical protein
MENIFKRLADIKYCPICDVALSRFPFERVIRCISNKNETEYQLFYSTPNGCFWGLIIKTGRVSFHFSNRMLLGSIYINGVEQKFRLPTESLFDGSFKKKINMFKLLQ